MVNHLLNSHQLKDSDQWWSTDQNNIKTQPGRKQKENKIDR